MRCKVTKNFCILYKKVAENMQSVMQSLETPCHKGFEGHDPFKKSVIKGHKRVIKGHSGRKRQSEQ